MASAGQRQFLDQSRQLVEIIEGGVMDARLTPLDRALVWGQVVEGLSYRELAAIHGRPETALRSRCCRAKQRLAAWLGDGTKEEGGSR